MDKYGIISTANYYYCEMQFHHMQSGHSHINIVIGGAKQKSTENFSLVAPISIAGKYPTNFRNKQKSIDPTTKKIPPPAEIPARACMTAMVL